MKNVKQKRDTEAGSILYIWDDVKNMPHLLNSQLIPRASAKPSNISYKKGLYGLLEESIAVDSARFQYW